MTTAALLLAAGRGIRAGGGLPKQYRKIFGEPVLRRCIRAFSGHRLVDVVRVIIHPDDIDFYREAAEGLDILPPVSGGAERHLSALLGLESLADISPRNVLIHDAARPFVGRELIERVVQRLDGATAAIPAVPVSDTLKRVEPGNDLVQETVDRTALWRAQTPQGFRYRDIVAAHRDRRGAAHTDDAAVMEASGRPVTIVEGDETNTKLTTDSDFERSEVLLASRFVTRVGMGFDVHRFGPGNKVMLCGVEVPFDQGLEGHSDADVALHALTDALLGAVGAGDIGLHFPPSDNRWKGAESRIFVEEALKLIRSRNGIVDNVDITIIGERPRVGPHREMMRATVSRLLQMPADRVNIKATTTERLGFTGRGEGLAAQAVVSVRLP